MKNQLIKIILFFLTFFALAFAANAQLKQPKIQ